MNNQQRDEFFALCKERVNQHIERQLDQYCASPRLLEAMRYATLNGGKRIRPIMVYGAAQAMGLSLEQVDDMACAVELVHSYSLVHDDLPAMDDDDLRRGQPTVHKAFDEATAILVGDGLLTLAFEVLASGAPHTVDLQSRLKMISCLSKASGLAGMVGGQAVDFEAMGQRLGLKQLETMHHLKTGALIAASAEIGALAAEQLDDRQLDAIRSYANNIGLAFQVRDDILDVTGDTATLGKPQGSDESLNKPTYVALLGLDDARAKALTLAQRAVADLEDFSEQAGALRALALYVVERVH